MLPLLLGYDMDGGKKIVILIPGLRSEVISLVSRALMIALTKRC